MFSCEVLEETPLPPSEEAIGLDLGVLHFATLSTGEQIENPRHYRKGLKRIKVLSQIKDRRKKGSHRRKRAAIVLAKAHRQVRNQRANFQHQLSRRLVNEYRSDCDGRPVDPEHDESARAKAGPGP